MELTILEDGRATAVGARVDGERAFVSAADLERATRWTLKPQGLCRDEVCVPVAPSSSVVAGGDVDLIAFADLLGRPIACDFAAGVASIGDSAAERSALMRGGIAPDFTLPDLSGQRHSLGALRGRKVLLVAWASW